MLCSNQGIHQRVYTLHTTNATNELSFSRIQGTGSPFSWLPYENIRGRAKLQPVRGASQCSHVSHQKHFGATCTSRPGVEDHHQGRLVALVEYQKQLGSANLRKSHNLATLPQKEGGGRVPHSRVKREAQHDAVCWLLGSRSLTQCFPSQLGASARWTLAPRLRV